MSYRGETVNGYWALVAALRRAVDEGVPITNAEFLAEVTQPRWGECSAARR